MKSCKTTLYFSILALTALPLSVRAMDIGDGDIVPAAGTTNGNSINSGNIFKEEIPFEKFIVRSPKLEDFNDELFDLTTDASQSTYHQAINAPVPADKNQSKYSLSTAQAAALGSAFLSTGTYVLNNMNLDLLTKRGGIDLTTGTRVGIDPAALLQTIFSGIQVIAVPAMIYFTYTEIGNKRLLEQLAKRQTRQIAQQNEYIQRLVTGLKQHEISAQQVVKAQYKTLTRIHGKIAPIAQFTAAKNCGTCTKMIAQATIASHYVAKKMTDFEDVHNDIPDLIANTAHTKVTWNPKSWFQRLREICRKHQEEEEPNI